MTLSVQNLTLQHQRKILLKDVCYTINSGKTTVLLGVSGSGKTLSTLALQDLLPSNIKKIHGEVLLNNTAINPAKSRARIFASIMQNPITCFNPLYSMKTHMAESLKAINIKWDSKLIRHTLEEVNLGIDTLSLYPFEMSGGMLQRMMIALALLSKAPFLIADEPTTNLDSIVQYKILSLLKEMQNKHKVGILLITHDLDTALKMADFIVILENGNIRESFECKKENGYYQAETLKKLRNSEIPIMQRILQRYQTLINMQNTNKELYASAIV